MSNHHENKKVDYQFQLPIRNYHLQIIMFYTRFEPRALDCNNDIAITIQRYRWAMTSMIPCVILK